MRHGHAQSKLDSLSTLRNRHDPLPLVGFSDAVLHRLCVVNCVKLVYERLANRKPWKAKKQLSIYAGEKYGF